MHMGRPEVMITTNGETEGREEKGKEAGSEESKDKWGSFFLQNVRLML